VGVPSRVWLSTTPSLPRVMAWRMSSLALRPRKRSWSRDRATSEKSRSMMLAVQVGGTFWAANSEAKAFGVWI